jgi:hypothetical protein
VTFTSSTTTVPVTLTITTTGSGSKASSAQHIAFSNGRRLFEIAAVLSFGICLVPLGLRRRYARTIVTFVALVAIVTAVACGGGNTSGRGGGGGGGGGSNATPPGTYNGITLNVAVGGSSQFIYLNVDVQ